MTERDKAKEYYKTKDYEKAVDLYEKLWSFSDKNNHDLLAEYGNALRKANKSQDFIKEFAKISKDSYLRKNNYVISVLCWCAYDVYIKDYVDNEEANFEQFIKMAEFVTKNSKQNAGNKEMLTPFVLTVKKVVKIYNNKPSSRTSKTNQEKIIEWLEKLDSIILSEECLTTTVGENDYEQASSKEFYYQNMTKAYEKVGEYEKCILIGEEALKLIDKFHYKNKIWITGRILFSKCMISSNKELSLENYKKFAEKENYWFLWYKLANICYSLGMFKESLLYNCKAIYNERIDEKMVTLLFNLGLCWESQGNQENAKKYYQASAYFRNLMGWNLTEELQYYVFNYNLDIVTKPNMYALNLIAKEYIDKNDIEYLYGKIDKILKDGFSGFINQDNSKDNIYFNMRSVIGNKKILQKDRRVKYKKIINEKGKTEAICVEGVE